MKNLSKNWKNWIYVLIASVLAICLCCSFTACTKAQAESASPSTPTVTILDTTESMVGFDNATDETRGAEENYSRWLSDHYSAQVYTCEQWLNDVMSELHLTAETIGDSTSVYSAAQANGIIDTVDTESFTALTRRFVAQTLVRALGYEARSIDGITDLTAADTDMSTLVYYGYFVPDEDGKVYPDAQISGDEYQALINEVRRYSKLSGKNVLSFGDSIMYGMGNDSRGISDIISEKYGMTNLDFSISGATFGVCEGHSIIPKQIKNAVNIDFIPDIILIDGGTNDMAFVERGDISTSTDGKTFDRNTFAGGFEYAAALLQKYWKNVPVVYVRAHDMGRRNDAVERDYGELGLRIARKWNFSTVDIYTGTDFCTEIDTVRDKYTLYKERLSHSDGVHPTALGYAKYYLPLVSKKVDEVLG